MGRGQTEPVYRELPTMLAEVKQAARIIQEDGQVTCDELPLLWAAFKDIDMAYVMAEAQHNDVELIAKICRMGQERALLDRFVLQHERSLTRLLTDWWERFRCNRQTATQRELVAVEVDSVGM